MPAGDDSPKPPFMDRVRTTLLKGESGEGSPPPGVAAGTPASVPELENLVKRADDKERLVGVLGAPVGAAIGSLVIEHAIATNPAKYLADGQLNHLYVNVSTYHLDLVALLVLSLGMMAAGLLRKRLAIGMAMALFGLTVFNLHYWGFGVPYLMAGAWLMVRGYRLQRSLAEASGTAPARHTAGARPVSRPSSNKRYTPPGTR